MSSALDGVNSLYSNTYTNSLTNSNTNSLENTLGNSDLSNASEDQLMTVCKDFEEYFVEQMVKSMVKMSKISSDDDANDYSSIFGMDSGASDSGMSTMSGYYGDQMVSLISKQLCDQDGGKGLGLAQTLYEQMKRNYGISDTPSTDKDSSSSEQEPATDSTQDKKEGVATA